MHSIYANSNNLLPVGGAMKRNNVLFTGRGRSWLLYHSMHYSVSAEIFPVVAL